MQLSITIVTSIHPDFDARIWKHARLLSDSGHNVKLICPWTLPNRTNIDGIDIYTFTKAPHRIIRPLWYWISLVPLLILVIRRSQIVHFHDLDLLPIMTLIALVKPVVYDVHENYPDEMLEKEWIPKLLRPSTYYVVKYVQLVCSLIIKNIVLVAPSQEKYFGSSSLHKTYLYNYASISLIEEVADNYESRSPCVIFTGSQHLNNGSMLLLDIAHLVVKKNVSVKFIMIDRFSDYKFREQFYKKRSSLELENNVIIVGNIKPQSIMEYLNTATIGISPNLRVPQQINGIHTKLFEYMAAGIPMIISDLPHQKELIMQTGSGYAEMPESPEDFANAIIKLTENPSLAMAMGRSAQIAFLDHYCYESQLAILLRFYNKIVARY